MGFAAASELGAPWEIWRALAARIRALWNLVSFI
jgi:hypothetical protein